MEQRIDFSREPALVGFSDEFNKNKKNCLKGCKWSPDGTCILTNSEDHCLRLFNLPSDIYCKVTEHSPPIDAVLRMQESGTVYDYCWYPGMSSADPDTCCLASTSKDNPIHLWDAFTGELRCTYSAYDQADEMTSAHSVAFSVDGQTLFCGFNKMLRTFDVNQPGRMCTKQATYCKKTKSGQCGIVSCIAASPVDVALFATGSYSKQIALYTTSSDTMVCMLEGHQGGVTHLLFSPDGTKIFSGGRKDPEILCWDLRNPGRILCVAPRQVETNQRIYFDLSQSSQHLISGNHNGTISVWDTLDIPHNQSSAEEECKLSPLLSYTAHCDGVNGVSLHPTCPLLASSSGQRHILVDEDSEEEVPESYSNDLRIWWFPYDDKSGDDT
ncbi:telomerase Cajal body protein 1 isoform X1 [Argonauta hians]